MRYNAKFCKRPKLKAAAEHAAAASFVYALYNLFQSAFFASSKSAFTSSEGSLSIRDTTIVRIIETANPGTIE